MTTPAAMGQPETGQTLYRPVGPTGELRPDGEKRPAVGRQTPTGGGW